MRKVRGSPLGGYVYNANQFRHGDCTLDGVQLNMSTFIYALSFKGTTKQARKCLNHLLKYFYGRIA